MMSSIGSAMSGMARAIERLDGASVRIAQPGGGELVRDRVDQMMAQRSFEANLATVRTADDMLGTLIDIVV